MNLSFQNIESLSPKDALGKVWLKFKDALCQVWLKLAHPPLEKSEALHLNKLDSSLHKDVLCQVCLLVGPVDLEKIFKLPQCIFTISSLCPLGKGRGPLFVQTWIFLTEGCAKFGMENTKICKVHRRKQIDRQQLIRKTHLSFQLCWAKMSCIKFK